MNISKEARDTLLNALSNEIENAVDHVNRARRELTRFNSMAKGANATLAAARRRVDKLYEARDALTSKDKGNG